MAEIGSVCPVNEIRGCEEADNEVSSVRNDCNPFFRRCVPQHFWIAKLGAVDRDDWVIDVFGECVATVCGIGDILRLFLRRVQGVHSHNAIGLVWKETARVIYIYHCRAGEDALAFSAWIYSDLLVLPGVQISRSSMAPVLVTSHNVRWIV